MHAGSGAGGELGPAFSPAEDVPRALPGREMALQHE